MEFESAIANCARRGELSSAKPLKVDWQHRLGEDYTTPPVAVVGKVSLPTHRKTIVRRVSGTKATVFRRSVSA